MFKSSAFALICLGLMFNLPAQAHKLKVFATAEGDRIEGEAYFIGGAKAAGASIAIADSKGHELARLIPDAEGHFSYQATRRMDYLVIADSQDGHQARWTIKADELAASLPLAEVADLSHGVSEQASPPYPSEKIEGTAPLETSAIVALVERAVARQVRPLREELEGYGERVRMRDILGGIGYIVGIAGLGVWWRSRRQARKS